MLDLNKIFLSGMKSKKFELNYIMILVENKYYFNKNKICW